MTDYFDLRDKFRPKHERFVKVVSTEVPVEEPVIEPVETVIKSEKAFVVSGSNGKFYVTGPVTDLREEAA